MNRMPASIPRVIALLLFAGLVWVPAVQAQESRCGTLQTHYGPFDYRSDRHALPIVEKHHFTAAIEQLIPDHNGPNVPGHLAYTLHAFPNHHRALYAIIRYGEKMKSKTPPNLELSIDCYFERALRFRADDTVARLIFADYLVRTNRSDEAVTQIDYVRSIAKDNPLTQYNLGLMYFQAGRYDAALAQAHIAIALGVERDDLKKKLVAKGQWAEPVAPAASGNSP